MQALKWLSINSINQSIKWCKTIKNGLQEHSMLFDRSYITSYWWPVFDFHRLQDTTMFAVYVTARDIKKSFSFNNTVEITSYVHILIHM